MPLCAACGKKRASNRCARCLKVCYCNAECQRAHWSVHKRNCKGCSDCIYHQITGWIGGKNVVIGNYLDPLDPEENAAARAEKVDKKVQTIQTFAFNRDLDVDLYISQLNGRFRVYNLYAWKTEDTVYTDALVRADVVIVNPSTLNIAAIFEELRDMRVIVDDEAYKAQYRNDGLSVSWAVNTEDLMISEILKALKDSI